MIKSKNKYYTKDYLFQFNQIPYYDFDIFQKLSSEIFQNPYVEFETKRNKNRLICSCFHASLEFC